MKVGDRFETINFGPITVTGYNGSFNVEVVFDGTGYKTVTCTSNIISGRVKDKMARSIFGVGFIGDGPFKSNENGRQSEAYSRWVNMMSRCYDAAFHAANPTYIGCSVCKEWHNFQTFADWYTKNKKHGHEIDKDILYAGNKIYSKRTCLLVPQWLNKFITKSGGSGACAVGVDYVKRLGKFRARCRNPKTGENVHLGLFRTELEAKNAWAKAKKTHAISLREEFDLIDERIFGCVMAWIDRSAI